MASAPNSQPEGRPASRKFYFAALVSLSVLALYITGVSTTQIINAALFPETPPTNYTCRDGVAALYSSVSEAKNTVDQTPLSERQAVEAFRSSLSETWQHSASIKQSCVQDDDKQALRALRQVELLRYAEERSVRYSSFDLAAVRKSTPELVHLLSSQNAPKELTQ